MKLGLLYAAVCTFALSIGACVADSTDSDEQASGNNENNNGENTGCENSHEICYCIDVENSSDCPTGYTCQIADSPQPPYQGICFRTCTSNTDTNCVPPSPPACDENTDPNCTNNGGNHGGGENQPGCNTVNCP